MLTIEQKLDIISSISNKEINKPPMIIEFSGTPNSGKTSLIKEINEIFSRYEINCKILCETAQYCRIINKKSPQFNFWTILETIQQIISAIDKGYKIILCDRGIFDAITWMRYYCNNKQIKENDYRTIVNFYTLNIWKQFLQYVVLITCEPEVAIDRDIAYQEFKKYGTIINPKTLLDINNAIKETVNQYSDTINIVPYDTTKDIINVKDKIKKQLFDDLFNYMT